MCPKPVTIKGYAISGGGRAIYRVELSVDGGKTWEPVDKIDQNPHPISGMYWAWALWEKKVPKILTTSELVVRACKIRYSPLLFHLSDVQSVQFV